jgi:hypothetical protein
LISPGGTVKGLLEKSPLYEDYIMTPKVSGRTQTYTSIHPHGVHMDSWWNPTELLGGFLNSMWTPWELPSNMWLSVMPSTMGSHLIIGTTINVWELGPNIKLENWG